MMDCFFRVIVFSIFVFFSRKYWILILILCLIFSNQLISISIQRIKQTQVIFRLKWVIVLLYSLQTNVIKKAYKQNGGWEKLCIIVLNNYLVLSINSQSTTLLSLFAIYSVSSYYSSYLHRNHRSHNVSRPMHLTEISNNYNYRYQGCFKQINIF